jgi:hypothetical protein
MSADELNPMMQVIFSCATLARIMNFSVCERRIKMVYFLFLDNILGKYFVIEGDDDMVMEDAWEEAILVIDDEDELEYIGTISAEEVDAKGYDVY